MDKHIRNIITVALLLAATTISATTNVTGRITCDGKGVAGVSVTDGTVWATTDSNGKYALDSDKRNGSVYYVLPSGYEPTSDDGFSPRFWAALDGDVKNKERHDFVLNKVDNSKCDILISADHHLAARNADIAQFGDLFVSSVNRHVKAASHPVYSLFLGDICWDNYWYSNHFQHRDHLNMMRRDKYPTLVFPTMGNHDNDGATPEGDDCDFNASAEYRSTMAPRYYSLNLGGVHIIMLDNIKYFNHKKEGKKYNDGIYGARDYVAWLTDDQLAWVAEDVARISDKNTPIIIGMHIHTWKVASKPGFPVIPILDEANCKQLADVLADFKQVNLVSGHTHYNFHAHPSQYPNMKENNIAAVCATWWGTGLVSGRHICRDGSPGGYAVYNIDGKDMKWRYEPIDPVDSIGSHQMRIYDMNTVKAYYKQCPTMKRFMKQADHIDYAKCDDNLVLVNIFNYDTDWKVEILEDGKPLDAKRVIREDPLHVICYDIPLTEMKKKPGGGGTGRFTHFFEAKAQSATKPIMVRVTDSFGEVYSETLVRPKAFNKDMR